MHGQQNTKKMRNILTLTGIDIKD